MVFQGADKLRLRKNRACDHPILKRSSLRALAGGRQPCGTNFKSHLAVRSRLGGMLHDVFLCEELAQAARPEV